MLTSLEIEDHHFEIKRSDVKIFPFIGVILFRDNFKYGFFEQEIIDGIIYNFKFFRGATYSIQNELDKNLFLYRKALDKFKKMELLM